MEMPNATLPPGYTGAVDTVMTRQQIMVLYYPRASGWTESQFLLEGYQALHANYLSLGVKTEYFSVLDKAQDTVGVGLLRYTDAGEADLSCLAVMSDQQGRGIGKWLINKRVQRARDLGVTALFVGRLSQENTLASYYAELGFRAYNGAPKHDLLRGYPPQLRVPQLVLEQPG